MRYLISLLVVSLCVLSARAETSTITGPHHLTHTPERITFTGRVLKAPTEDPRVLGGTHRLVNESGVEYRIISYEYALDLSRLQAGETVETDIGLTILPPGVQVSLNSGEELLVTHQYDAPIGSYAIRRVDFPAGGFPLGLDHTLTAATVSGVFPNDRRGAIVLEDERIADGRFMSLYYRIELIRADLVEGPGLSSYRSPYRDRSYVPDPNRSAAPYTDYRNQSSEPIQVYGLGVFLSNLSSYEPSTHSVEITLDGQVVTDLPLPGHRPGESSPALPLMIPVNLTVQPGQVVGIRGKVDVPNALVFDFAAFLVADPGMQHVNERLDVVPFDVNGDGHDDIVDIDAEGSIWVSMRIGDGLQNTQQEWLRRIGDISSLSVSDDGRSLLASNDAGLCVRLTPRPEIARFLPDLCSDDGDAPDPSDIWGDFNGDGLPDRLSVDNAARTYSVEIGTLEGLSSPSVWASGFGQVERWFEFDGDGDGRTDMLGQWHEGGDFRCAIWRSTGASFALEDC